nr:cyclin-dependent kinase inhibitor 1B isoform X2 [Zonotrichia albicollis]
MGVCVGGWGVGGAGLKRTKQGAKPRLGSAASGAGAAVGLTLPSRGWAPRAPFPRTVRVQARSWKRGWRIVSDASGFRGASPVSRPPGAFSSPVSCRRMSRPPRVASQEVGFKGNPGTFSKSERCKSAKDVRVLVRRVRRVAMKKRGRCKVVVGKEKKIHIADLQEMEVLYKH